MEVWGYAHYSEWPKVADAVIEASKAPIYGLDHGVGHSLLLLYDAKAPHGQKSKEFKGLRQLSLQYPLKDYFVSHQNILFV